MILVDTSVWVHHLHRSDSRLASVLEVGDVCIHPFVIGEMACARLRNRREVLDLLAQLPSVPVASDTEVLVLVEERALMGRGLGLIDIHLLASLLLATDVGLWTRDRRLAAAANELGLGSR